jgi:hypothetical protein
MKHILKLIIAINITVILFALPACSKPADGDNLQTGNPSGSSQKDESKESKEAAPERFTPNLPDRDLNGYEFRALVCANNVYGFYTFDAKEESGDTLDDAIYKRNRYIEEKYNVVLKQTEIKDFMQLSVMFKKSVTSGSDDFDIALQIDRYGYDLAVEGYALSADKLPYLDLSQPWYNHDINDAFSVGNKYFLSYSDECLHLYECSQIVCFNKQLVADLALENPYDLVNAGNWTYDKFFDLCRAAASDIDGDGKMTDADRYGVVCDDAQFLPNFWVCAGISTIVKDSSGMLTLNFDNNENFYNMLDRAREGLFGGNKIYFCAGTDNAAILKPRNEYGARDISLQQFENKLALFNVTSIGRIPHMRAVEMDFGIVPFPKADENQSRYITRVSGGWPKIVPNHAPDPERTSIVLEAIAAESRNIVIPAFKEINLKTKQARDNESAEMLDIIFNNRFADMGDVIFLDVICVPFINEIRGSGNFASLVEKTSANFQKALDKVNKSAANLD